MTPFGEVSKAFVVEQVATWPPDNGPLMPQRGTGWTAPRRLLAGTTGSRARVFNCNGVIDMKIRPVVDDPASQPMPGDTFHLNEVSKTAGQRGVHVTRKRTCHWLGSPSSIEADGRMRSMVDNGLPPVVKHPGFLALHRLA